MLFIVFLLGLFSLGGLVFPALLIMGLVLTGLTLAFLLSGSYFSKLIISQVVGQLILGAFKSPAAKQPFSAVAHRSGDIYYSMEYSLHRLDLQHPGSRVRPRRVRAVAAWAAQISRRACHRAACTGQLTADCLKQ